MTKKLKKIAASVMAVAALAVGAAGMTASAETFYFDLGAGLSSYRAVTKYNDESYATVNVTDSCLSSTAKMSFVMKTTNEATLSAASTRTANGSFKLNYNNVPGYKTNLRLYATAAGQYRTWAEGNVTP